MMFYLQCLRMQQLHGPLPSANTPLRRIAAIELRAAIDKQYDRDYERITEKPKPKKKILSSLVMNTDVCISEYYEKIVDCINRHSQAIQVFFFFFHYKNYYIGCLFYYIYVYNICYV